MTSTIETSTTPAESTPKHPTPSDFAQAAAKFFVASKLAGNGCPVYSPHFKDGSHSLVAEIDGVFVKIWVDRVERQRPSIEYFGIKPDAVALVCLRTRRVEWFSTNKGNDLPPTLRNMNVMAGEERSPKQHSARESR